MGKVNAKGRTKHVQFVRLHRGVTDSPAWKSLTCEARSLMIEIWQRHNGSNNGEIALSRRQIREALGIGHTKITAATEQLVDRGFIIVKRSGSFDWKDGARAGKATEFEVTTEPCDGQPAKNTFRNWRPQKKSTVHEAITDGSQGDNRQHKNPPMIDPDGSRRVNDKRPISTSDGYQGVNTYTLPYTPGLPARHVEVMEGSEERGGLLVLRVFTSIPRGCQGRAAA